MQLIRYEAARKALQEAYSIDEVKDIRDKAEAMRAYAQQAKDEDLKRWAAEIKLRAEHKAGKLLKEMAETGERTSAGRPEKRSHAATISDLGVSKSESSRWQQTAELEDEELDAFIKNKPADSLTSAAVRKEASKKTNATKPTPEPPEGQYDVIVIDPPWPIEKITRNVRPNQINLDYPTMSIPELEQFPLPAAENCHLFCWTTQKFLPAALDLIKTWQFRYVLTMVWHKPGGFQPVGLPQYNCEFIVYARKGTPEFSDTKAFNCCFQAPRREHSRKPDEFYDLIKRTTKGQRIDVFSRENRPGFDQHGNEPTRFGPRPNPGNPEMDSPGLDHNL